MRRALGLLAVAWLLSAPEPATAQAAGPLDADALAGKWTLTLHPKPGLGLEVTDRAGRPVKDLAMHTWVEVRNGHVVGCLVQMRGESDPPKSVRCGLRKGAFTVEIHGSGNGQKGRLVVHLTRKASGVISGDASARAAVVPLGFNIGSATLTRGAV